MWKPNQPTRRNNHAHHYNQDYNTRQSYHYYQEYSHVPKNYIRTHFRGNYSRWLCQTTHFSCLKIGHISMYFPTRAKEPKLEAIKGKENVDVEHIRVEMNRTWQRRDHFTQEDHTSSN